jgi:hypothetical protein
MTSFYANSTLLGTRGTTYNVPNRAASAALALGTTMRTVTETSLFPSPLARHSAAHRSAAQREVLS